MVALENLFEQARTYAVHAHGEQKYGEHSYSVHLDDVDNILREFFHDSPTMRAAGQLHDVVEDTGKTLDDLREAMFPEGVIYLVDGVTSVPGPNRKTRNALTYPKIAEDLKRTTLKLADRIANGRRSAAENPGLHMMYRGEYPTFKAALYTADTSVAPMWAELDKLFGA